MNVTVVGAGGHVGLPLSLVLADSGHFVYGLDINKQANESVMGGRMPFIEEGADELLGRVLTAKRLQMTDDIQVIGKSEVLVVVIGTPIDENLNPRVEANIYLVRFRANCCKDGILGHGAESTISWSLTRAAGSPDACTRNTFAGM